MVEAERPSIIDGSNSRCVCSFVTSDSLRAINVFSSSSASRYSMMPCLISSFQVMSPFFILSDISFVSRGFPSFTTMSGLLALPPSVSIFTSSMCSR